MVLKFVYWGSGFLACMGCGHCPTYMVFHVQRNTGWELLKELFNGRRLNMRPGGRISGRCFLVFFLISSNLAGFRWMGAYKGHMVSSMLLIAH